MLDPDIHGRLRALKSEHLTALFDYLLGDEGRTIGHGWFASDTTTTTPQTKPPGLGRGVSR